MLDSIIYALYSFSQSLAQSGLELTNGYGGLAIAMLSATILTYVLVYVFRGIGVFTLSKRQGLTTPWLAFVPFAAYIQMGKLVGKCRIFRIETKNFGLWLFITYTVISALNLTYDLLFCVKDFLYIVSQDKLPAIDTVASLRGLDEMELSQFLLQIFSSLFGFVNVVFFIFFVILFFRFYGGKHTIAYSLLSIFFEITFGIFVFVCRNNDKRDYEAERRRLYEEAMRSGRAGGYGERRYGQPFDNQKSGSPFDEYKDKDEKQEDVFSDYPDAKSDKKDDGDDGDLF